MTIRTLILGSLAATLAAAAIPATAHHSYAMFDEEKAVTVEGTVKLFEWTNPHSWVHLMAPDAKGEQVKYSIEFQSPSGLARMGLLPKSLVPGDKISITFHPLKNGGPGGSFMAMKLPDGKVVGDARPRTEN